MKYLFVGGQDHGKIQYAEPDAMGIWTVIHQQPLRIGEISRDLTSSDLTSTYIERTNYRVREMNLFGERLFIMVAEGISAESRMLDAIVKPEVRDLMYRA